MLKGTINFEGQTLSDVITALEEAQKRIEAGNTLGFDRNSSGRFNFQIEGIDAEDLDEERRSRAEEAFVNFEFGAWVESSSGWEHSTAEPNVYKMPVFLQNQNPEEPTIQVQFAVTFEEGTTAIASREVS